MYGVPLVCTGLSVLSVVFAMTDMSLTISIFGITYWLICAIDAISLAKTSPGSVIT